MAPGRRAAARRLRRPAPVRPARCARRTSASSPTELARAAARQRPRAPRHRRPGRRLAERRRRLRRCSRRSRRRSPASALPTFSIGFAERSFDELDRARLVAPRLGTDHHEVDPRPGRRASCCRRSRRRSTSRLPTARRVPTYAVSRLAAQHVKVALSGEGGDELFGGYQTYAADLLAAAPGRRRRASRAPLARAVPELVAAACAWTTARALRARGAPAAARAPPRLEGDPLARTRAQLLAARTADASARPARRAARALRARPAGAEPLARLQDVDRAPTSPTTC